MSMTLEQIRDDIRKLAFDRPELEVDLWADEIDAILTTPPKVADTQRDYIADMEGSLNQIASLVGVHMDGSKTADHIIDAVNELVQRQPQGAQGKAIPSHWAAISDDGEIVVGYPTDDGNAGEVARTECNQYINDALVNDRALLHLVALYTHPAERTAVPEGMVLVPQRFVDLVQAASRATHPRAVPQLIEDAIEELATPTLAGKEKAG